MELKLENQQLHQKIAELEQHFSEASAQIKQLMEQLAAAQKRIAELEKLKTPPPFVKTNTKKDPNQPGKPRKSRPPEQNGSRRLELEPTEIIEKKPGKCPGCENRLGGLSFSRKRQVIELPEPAPLQVREYHLYKGWCSQCQKWHEVELDLNGEVLGQGRFGHRIGSIIGYLRETLRLPVRLIQQYLETLQGLKVSVGEIVELLHRLADNLKPEYAALKKACQDSPIRYADETGWREDGQNGYVWSMTSEGETPTRYYEYEHSREGKVAKQLVGKQPQGTTVSDFYAGYNDIGGSQQRCWAHLLRDLHKLKEQEPVQAEVLDWAEQVKALYQNGQALVHRAEPPPSEQERQSLYQELWEAAGALGRKYAKQYEHPCNKLAKRLLRHQDELFTFVLIPGLRADNNTAERSIRPVAVARKISGGTRSPKGSQTRMILRSLFGTWQLRGLNPLKACLDLLRSPVFQTSF